MSASQPAEWVTTSTVLDRLANYSDRGAWERLAERFRGPILAYARRRGLGEAECEDVAQESLLAFAEAYREGEYDRTRGRLSRWLFGIAWRRVEEARRGLARARGLVEETPSELDLAAPGEASPEWLEIWERSMIELCLRQARQEVEPGTFRAFEMLVLESRSVEETALELGLTANAVTIAKHRVGKRVRELVELCDEVRP
ncbi:MAG: RNA polymerase sigma factor [Planctomycetota bacterium]